ncbi:proliferation marker protein Ki-67 isoform X2 [Amblyraja radiata]|uniref:proliferation marker protein Ki-67 isoform X2 n=1 Tax=Amblyraja radiata TaxID=386614 RepID=UPI0014032D14|nr:proliferation marker protein Ki-67 isoform X2 [Amblyraja radiata]
MAQFGKVIVIKRTGADGCNFPLTSSSCLFGRKTDCDIRIQLPHVSKEHCKLEVNENNEVILINLSEVNQTLLNGEPIHHSERLKHRDTFTVIDRSFRFEYPLESVHNTSPRKKRNSSTLKNETLQQEIDDDSQSSVKSQSSSSGHKSDKIVDKGFKVRTKPSKSTPNGSEDPTLQSQHRRNSTKIRNDGKATHVESLSPFSKLYEMVKEEATKPIQTKPNKADMSASIDKSNTDLKREASIPAKESNVTISQNGKNSRTSESERTWRTSKINFEDGMMATSGENKEKREQNPQLIQDIANADFSILQTNTLEIIKLTEETFSKAKDKSITPLSKGANGKEQNNDQTAKGTPKEKRKKQSINCESLSLDAAPKKIEENLEPSVNMGQNLVVKHESFETEHTSGNNKKRKDESPKMFVQKLLHGKNRDEVDIEAEQFETTTFSEPSVAKSVVENLVGKKCTPTRKKEERFDTPKRRSRSSLHNKNVDGEDIHLEKVESTNILESSVAESDNENTAVNKSVKVGQENIDTPKRRSRSIRNIDVDRAYIDSEPVAFTNVLKSSFAKSDMEHDTVKLELTPMKIGEEKVATPKRQKLKLLRNKNVDCRDMESEQVESTNVLEISLAKLNTEPDAVNLGLVPMKKSKEKVDSPKRRSRSLRSKNGDGAHMESEQVESANVLGSCIVKSGMENETVSKGLMPAKIAETKVHTPKRQSQSSLLTNVNDADFDSEEVKCTDIMDSSTKKSQKINKSVDEGHFTANIDEEKVNTDERRSSLRNSCVQTEITTAKSKVDNNFLDECQATVKINEEMVDTPKRRGRSVHYKNVEAADICSEQTKFTNVLESSATKSKRGRTSLRDRNLETLDVQAVQAVTAELLESSIAGKSELEDKLSEMQHVDLPKIQDKSSPCKENGQTLLKSKSPVLRDGASLCSTFQRSKSWESNVIEYLTEAESLKRKDWTSKSPQRDLNEQTGKGSPSSSKKRRSENETTCGPVLKRKRVSFGENLSPEVFDKRMPPCSPLRKGGTPTRVSTPFSRALLKRASSIGTRAFAIQECSEQNENNTTSPMSNIDSTRVSPRKNKMSPNKVSRSTTRIKSTIKRSPSAKISSLITEQSSNVKNSSGKMSSPSSVKSSPGSGTRSQKKLSSSDTMLSSGVSYPITAGLFGSPQLKGRFSISLVAAPPSLTRSAKSLGLAQLDQSQQKPSSGGKKSRKSTRRSVSLLAGIQSRRQSGASFGNLLVKKSWAQVVKEGVARPQLRNVAKKPAVKRKRAKNVISKVTPARLVKEHFSTGHAASPVTIVIGKSQATNTKPTGHAPWPTRTVSSRRKVKEMDESFTGVAELFSTPVTLNERANPLLKASNIVDAQTASAVPIFQKTLENSATKTPKEAGVKSDTPLTVSVARRKAVLRLLKCRADLSCSSNSPCETTFKVTEMHSDAESNGDPQRTMKTPSAKGQALEDIAGVSKIVKTPRMKGQSVEDLVGVKRIMKTPRVKLRPVEDMVGVKRIMKTPRAKVNQIEHFVGIHKLLAESKQKPKSPEINYVGIKNIFCAEKEMENCDYSGLSEMFSTPVNTERISDSMLQICLSPNKPSFTEMICDDGETTETSEDNIIQIVETQNEVSRKETSSSGTPRARVTRTSGVRAKSIPSPYQEECIQGSLQVETSQTFADNGLIDFPQTEITECKDEQSLISTQVSPANKSLKESKIKVTGGKESIKNTPAKNGTEEVSEMNLTKTSLEKKIPDVDSKILFMPSKTTPGKKLSSCKQTGEVIMFNAQKGRSPKENYVIPNVPNVEMEVPESTTMSPIMSKNGSPDKKIKEMDNLDSPVTKSLQGRKNAKELFTAGKITPTLQCQDGKNHEIKEQASPERKSLKDNEMKRDQGVEIRSPTTLATSEGQILMAEIEEVMPLPPRKRPQRNKTTKNYKATGVEEATSVAKASQSKKGAQFGHVDELVNSPLEKLAQKKDVETEVMNNKQLTKTSIEVAEVIDLTVKDVNAPIAIGRPRRKKNINTEEMEIQKSPKITNTRKKAACCTRVEVTESNSLQISATNQEKSSKAISLPQGSVTEEAKSENVEVPKMINLAGSTFRSTRQKRVFEELLSEDFKQESAPVKRLRRKEVPDETLTRKMISNLTSSKVPDCAVETSQGMSNGREVSKRSCRRKNIVIDVNKFHESGEQPNESSKLKETNVCLKSQLIKKEKSNGEEMRRDEMETKLHTAALKESPSPIKRLLRKKVGQKITQNDEENVKELPCTRKLRRNVMEQKLKAAKGPCVPVEMHSGRQQKHVLIEEESVPSSRTRGRGKQAKKLLTKIEEQTDQQLTVSIADVQLDTTNKNEPANEKVKAKGRQRGKNLAKETPVCLSDIEGDSVRERKAHLNVTFDCSKVVNNSDEIEAVRPTRFSSKGRVGKTVAAVSEVTTDTKKTDSILFPVNKENARPKRNAKKGNSKKDITTELEVPCFVPIIEEEIVEGSNVSNGTSKEFLQVADGQITELVNGKPPGVTIVKRSKRKIVKEVAKEGLEISKTVDPVEIPGKSGRGMINKNTSAEINQELIIGPTENKQLESSVNKVEKRAKRGQNYIKETAVLSAAPAGKNQVINKRGRTNLQGQTDNDENVPQETGISMESSHIARRVTRAKKSREITEIDQELLQPLTSGLLTQVSVHPSKRTLRSKLAVAETTADVPKKAKKELVTKKETSQCSKTGRSAARKVLSISPQIVQPTGRITRSRK